MGVEVGDGELVEVEVGVAEGVEVVVGVGDVVEVGVPESVAVLVGVGDVVEVGVPVGVEVLVGVGDDVEVVVDVGDGLGVDVVVGVVATVGVNVSSGSGVPAGPIGGRSSFPRAARSRITCGVPDNAMPLKIQPSLAGFSAMLTTSSTSVPISSRAFFMPSFYQTWRVYDTPDNPDSHQYCFFNCRAPHQRGDPLKNKKPPG